MRTFKKALLCMQRSFTYLTLILLFSFTLNGKAQEYKVYTRIDRHVKSVPDSLDDNLLSLHSYLIQKAKTPREELRAFYIWIINNIRYYQREELMYDPNFLFYMGSRNCSTPNCVLEQKYAVCEGYTNLLQAFCQLSGIESYVISGYVRQKGIKYDRATHAWNAVKVDGKWLFIDATWGSANRGTKTYNAQDYFLVSADKFVMYHLPLSKQWQFLETPVSFSVFVQGETAVANYLKQQSSFYHYDDSIASLHRLSKLERLKKTAEDIAEANPSNRFNQAWEYYRYARISFNYENSQQTKNIDKLYETYRLMQKSKFLFSQCDGVPAGIMVRKLDYSLLTIGKAIDELEASD